MKENLKFCLKCGRTLDKKWNKRYDGFLEKFCNAVCKAAHEKSAKLKINRSSVRAARTGYEHKDFFNER